MVGLKQGNSNKRNPW